MFDFERHADITAADAICEEAMVLQDAFELAQNTLRTLNRRLVFRSYFLTLQSCVLRVNVPQIRMAVLIVSFASARVTVLVLLCLEIQCSTILSVNTFVFAALIWNISGACFMSL